MRLSQYSFVLTSHQFTAPDLDVIETVYENGKVITRNRLLHHPYAGEQEVIDTLQAVLLPVYRSALNALRGQGVESLPSQPVIEF